MRVRNPILFSGASIAGAPGTGEVALAVRTLGSGEFLARRTDLGIERTIQDSLSRLSLSRWRAPGNGTALIADGANALTIVGTATARNVTTTSRATRARRIGFVTAAVTASLAGVYYPQAMWTIGTGTGLGGFTATFQFVPSDASLLSAQRMFIGMSSSVAAPTNVEPNTLTNSIGIAQISTSNNLVLVYGGTTAQTSVDLGTNFPANGTSADFYELVIHADPGDTTIGYTVTRLNTGNQATGIIANTTPGTTLPANTVFLAPRAWICNNTAATAAGIDIAQITVESDA